ASGRAIWVWPTAFMTTMLTGFGMATFGLQMPFVEPAIWLSIIALGLLVALVVRAPVSLGTAIAGLFGVFHGYAHGLEAAAASLLTYAAGFSIATAGLHATGIMLGLFAKTAIEKTLPGVASTTESQRCSR